MTDGYDAPSCHDGREEEGGAHILEENVAWHFEQDVEDEEGEQGNVVILATHAKVGFQALDTGISDIDAEARNTSANMKWRDDAEGLTGR